MKRQSMALVAALTCIGGIVAAPATAANANGPRHTVVVSGLNNPRQLAFGPGGSLLIAEAGRGSLHPDSSNCFPGPEGTTCLGATGSISLAPFPAWQHNSKPLRIVTGLLSGGAPDGGSAVGSDGVSYGSGRVLIQETFFPPEALPASLPAWQNGRLLSLGHHGKLRAVANIAAVEQNKNPDGLQIESDPYAVLSLGHNRSVTADAAGNDLVLVDRHGARPFTVFPLHGCGGVRTDECDQEPVPTSLALGPDHALYVGELAHFEPNEARVWKVSPRTGHILGYYGKGGSICRNDQTGFTTITGVAFDRWGNLYVSELIGGDGSGQIVRISRNCQRTTMAVPAPAGIVVDRHGTIYVSVYSISDSDGAAAEPGGPALPPGQVWRVHF
jgi:hypothetical protein